VFVLYTTQYIQYTKRKRKA